ncbi:hypothetical protein [Aestuariivirga sp.]|uniref:hypothetical protein n=1 Tax=Aestuariivirga sp. TaxID=2650926 RepID=UPI003BABD6B9
MVILLQICIFIGFALFRGTTLIGEHLSPASPGSDTLCFTLKTRKGIWARHIGLVQQGGIPFVIRRERWYHRLLKKLGIASEISAGHETFDRTFFITTNFPGHLEQLLASKELQAAVRKLFDLPVKSLHATRRRIWCTLWYKDLHKSDEELAGHLTLLKDISAASQASFARERAPAAWRWRGGAALLFIALQAGVLMFGLLGSFPAYFDWAQTVNTYSLAVTGLAAGVIAAILWTSFIIVVFSESPWTSWVLADFVLFGFLGFVLSGMVVLREVNVMAPQPAATVYLQPVVEKICVLQCKMGRRRRARRLSYTFHTDSDCAPQRREEIRLSKIASEPICASSAWFDYSLRVKHWQQGEPYMFSASSFLFDAVQTGSTVRLPVHPGALGFQWLVWDEIQAN